MWTCSPLSSRATFVLSSGAYLDLYSGDEREHDMAAFVARHADASLKERLQRAIAGRGAFRRFRDLIVTEDLTDTLLSLRRIDRAPRALTAGEISAACTRHDHHTGRVRRSG